MKLIDKTLDLIAPNDCLVCEREGSLVCINCELDFTSPIPSRCYICRQLTDEYAVCRMCKYKSRMNNLWVVSSYNENVKLLINELKYKSNRSASKIISQQFSEVLPVFEDDTVVVNIPTATRRVRMRSFDHTKLISKELAKILDLHYCPALVRTGQTRQVGSTRNERLKQMSEAFMCTKNLKDKRVLLVDDVITTGATMESASIEIRKSGAKRVYGVVLAQK